MKENNIPEVYIDGVKYVPAESVLVDNEFFIDALIAQFNGTPVDESARTYAMNYLRVLVSDGLSEDEGESMKEFIERLSTHSTNAK